MPKPSNLGAPEMAFEIFKGSNGTIASIKKLILRAAEVALKAGHARITFDTLKNARDWRDAASLIPTGRV